MSLISANKLAPATGTQVEIGDSGDTISIPAGVTITNSGTANNFGGGKVAQCLTVQITDKVTTTSTTYVDVTGLTLNITPAAATSKVLCFVDINASNAANLPVIGRVLRDSTEIGSGVAVSSRPGAGFLSADSYANQSERHTLVILDSPSTSGSAVTYKVQFRVQTGGSGQTATINTTHSDTDADYVARLASRIILMEITA